MNCLVGQNFERTQLIFILTKVHTARQHHKEKSPAARQAE